MSRVLEKCVVKSYIYPVLHDYMTDQYAFRPSGSTTTALVSLIHTVLSLLGTNQYVRVIALDFSKAFDTVRHGELFSKLSKMNFSDAVYNWMQDFYSGRSYCTKYGGDISQLAAILASVVQGYSLGPASFILTTADLQPVHDGNRILKYADDTYLVVPEVNEHTCESELTHVYEWAATNNLTLNCAKSKIAKNLCSV